MRYKPCFNGYNGIIRSHKLYNRNIERSHSFLLNVLDQTIQNNVHSEALETNRNHLSIAHLNTQSMSSTFDEPQVMVSQHPFDIITLSETWLRNDSKLLQYVQIPGYSFCYKNRDGRRGGGVRRYIKNTIKYKEWQDLSKIDETIEHIIIIAINKYLYRANSSVVILYTKLYTIYTLLSWRPCKT